MKKTSLILFGAAIIFLFAARAEAVTIKISPNSEEIKHRYGGSIVRYDTGFDQEFWYINPTTLDRYQIHDANSLARILRDQAVIISDKELAKIPADAVDKVEDYQIFSKYRGMFATQVQKNGEAWYIHPLDQERYYIENDNKGFNTIQKLAIDITKDKLQIFPLGKREITSGNKQIDFEPFWSALSTIKENYYQPIDNKDLLYGAITGLTAGLKDPYSIFFTPNESKDFTNLLHNSVEGIGAVVDTVNGVLTIVSPLENSPAQRAGLLPDDQVLAVDGQDIAGYTTDQATALIKGTKGVPVTLHIYRPSSRETFDVSITRAVIEITNVTSKKLDGNIAYIKINMFSQSTDQDFALAYNNVVDQNTRGIILDLRNNPGGFTNEAAAVADRWLPADNLILREAYPNSFYDYVSQNPDSINIPAIVLVNKGTASAAEILTAALQEYKKARIVGINSFGKGTGQFLQNYEDGSSLKITVFKWLTPELHSIDGVGVTPDFIVEQTDNIKDTQLNYALGLLR